MKPIFVPIFLAVFISCGGQKKPSADVGRKIVGDTVPKFSYDSTQDLFYNISNGYRYEFTEDGERFCLSDDTNSYPDRMGYLKVEKQEGGKWVFNSKVGVGNRGGEFDDVNKDGYRDIVTIFRPYIICILYLPHKKSFDTTNISLDGGLVQLDSVNKVFYSWEYGTDHVGDELLTRGTLFQFKDYKLVNYYTLVLHQKEDSDTIISADLYKYVKGNPEGRLVKRYKYSDEFDFYRNDSAVLPFLFWKNHYKQLLKDY